MSGEAIPRGRLAELREAFDRSFAEQPVRLGDTMESLLEIGIGEHAYALRMSEIVGLFGNRTTTRLPAAVPELLGIAGVRGSILPVYDLGAFLDAPLAEAPRWLVVAADQFVGLAFARFHRHLRVTPEAFVRHDEGDRTNRHLREGVIVGDRLRPVVSVDSILATIARRIRPDLAHQEG